jgi:hypothetical protein
MANSTDFRADQVQTSKIIVTGSNPQKTLLIYGIDADDSPANQGNIDPAVFNTSSIGSDVFLFVSGTVGGRGGVVPSIVAFGGDLHVSGNLTIDGTYPSGGGGTNFFTEIALDAIETTGSVAMTFLSASTGGIITGSLIAPTITGSIQYVDGANTIPFLTASTNITANYNSLGQWEITGSGGGFTAAQLVALTQASNTELDAESLAYVVIDPSGTPTNRKTTLGRMGALPSSWVDETYAVIGPMALQAGTVTSGICFQRRRDGQKCTGVRLYWDGGVGAQTLSIDLWEYNNLPTVTAGTLVATGTISANAQGIISGSFSGAYTLLPDKVYVASWHNASYWPNYLAGPYFGLRDRSMFRDYVVVDGGVYKSGGGANAAPDTSLGVGSANVFEIEPLVTG